MSAPVIWGFYYRTLTSLCSHVCGNFIVNEEKYNI